MAEWLIPLLEALGSYIIDTVIDETGKQIIRIFTDDDGDGEADNPELPAFEFEDPGEGEATIIIYSPDGTMSVYDSDGNLSEQTLSEGYQLWYAENGALDKPFSSYTVSEALLLIIGIAAVVTMLSKLFRRRKF